MKIIYQAENITEAEIVKGMLISNDIEAHVSGYYLQGGVGELAPTDIAKVYVDDSDYDHARNIISEYEGDKSELYRDEGKNKVTETKSASKFIFTIIVVAVVAILAYWLVI